MLHGSTQGMRKHRRGWGGLFQKSWVHPPLQDELATLQQRDPEFFAYLKETDSDLLNFSLPPTSKDTDEDAAIDSADEDNKTQVGCLICSAVCPHADAMACFGDSTKEELISDVRRPTNALAC